MFIKGKCAIYIDKNLRVYENSTVIFVLCFEPLGYCYNKLKCTNLLARKLLCQSDHAVQRIGLFHKEVLDHLAAEGKGRFAVRDAMAVEVLE